MSAKPTLKRGVSVIGASTMRADTKGALDPSKVSLVKKRKVKADDKNGTAVLEAALKGDLKFLDKLSKGKYDVNAQDVTDGQTALHIALYAGNDDFFKKLLTNPTVNVNMKAKDGETPLHVAAVRGREDLVLDLLERRARPDAENNQGQTPIHLAISNFQNDVLGPLLDAADCDHIDRFALRKGNSLLLEAASCGNHRAIVEFIRRGANINFQNPAGNTALHLAVLGNHTNCIAALKGYHPDLSIKNNSGLSAANLALQIDPDLVKIVQKEHLFTEETPLPPLDSSKLSFGRRNGSNVPPPPFSPRSSGPFNDFDDFIPQAPVFQGKWVYDLPPPDWTTVQDPSKASFRSKNMLPFDLTTISAPSSIEIPNARSTILKAIALPPVSDLPPPPSLDALPPPPSSSYAPSVQSYSLPPPSSVYLPPVNFPPPPPQEFESLPLPPPMGYDFSELPPPPPDF